MRTASRRLGLPAVRSSYALRLRAGALGSRSGGVSARALSSKSGGFFELRTDTLEPRALSQYLKENNQTAAARKQMYPGWLGMWKTEIGGCVHQVHHLYKWDDYDQRDEVRAEASDHPLLYGVNCEENSTRMVLPLPSLRERLQSSRSVAMIEAVDTLQGAGLSGAAGFAPAPAADEAAAAAVAWELRTYQLVLGYSTVPRFLKLYGEGLVDKLAADTSGASQLATLLYSDSGPLNVVHELWRHETMQRSHDSRAASRKATKWKAAIEEIATFTTSFDTQFLRPLRSSPWR